MSLGAVVILTVCMMTSPDGGRTFPPCKEVVVSVSEDIAAGDAENPVFVPGPSLEGDPKNRGGFSPFACQMIGTAKGAEYVRDHPGWIVRRWSCPPPRRSELET